MAEEPHPLVIVGPTCVGKTAAAVALAGLAGSVELVSADSRQVRRGLVVGTCAPTPEELAGVACHLVGIVDPSEPFTVADWLVLARRTLDEIRDRGGSALVVGGTGLYVEALLSGFRLGGPPDPAQRRELERIAAAPGGLDRLGAELAARDPEAATRLDLRNPRRLIRALETLRSHPGMSLARARGGREGIAATVVGLDLPAALHAERVRLRVEAMFGRPGGPSPLLEETARALETTSVAALSRCGIGYAEAVDVLGGSCGVEEAVRRTIQRTLRYAKAQRTFFRPRVVRWVSAEEPASCLAERVRELWSAAPSSAA